MKLHTRGMDRYDSAAVYAVADEVAAPERDTKRLDWIEAKINEGNSGGVRLHGWWSNDDAPDGYAVSDDRAFANADEHPTLRAAIDDAMESSIPESSLGEGRSEK